MKFTEFGLDDYIVSGLASQGIETATEIQEVALPLIKSGVDVIGLSQTGSGKTYAYVIPALEQIDTELSAVQFLVVCPTRELAGQVAEDFRKLTSLASKINVAPIVGGSSMDRQVQTLKKGVKVVIGTPGRLMDHLRKKTLKLDKLKMIVLDEADEMLDMGFKEDIETILKNIPDAHQTVMFSATMPPEIMRITKQYMKEPSLIKTKNQDGPHALIKQYYVNCKKEEKVDALKRIYEKFNPWISIVFCNTKRMTEELSRKLTKEGLPAVCLHGDMRQNERRRTMENFKKDGNGGILVATDVAARGIDIKNVDIVVNYDFPNNEDYYVHRIGRTGRAGKGGVALTIINTKIQSVDLQVLIKKTGGKIEECEGLSTTKWETKELKQSEAKQQMSNRGFNIARSNKPKSSGFGTNGPRMNDGKKKEQRKDRNSSDKSSDFFGSKRDKAFKRNVENREVGSPVNVKEGYKNGPPKRKDDSKRSDYSKRNSNSKANGENRPVKGGFANRFEKSDQRRESRGNRANKNGGRSAARTKDSRSKKFHK